MVTQKYAIERHVKTASEVRNVAVSFVDELDSGELLTGTPTVAEVTTSDLSLTNKAVNTAALTISGKAVAIGQAVQFKVSGGTAGTTYTIKVTVSTDATPAQTLICALVIEVLADS